MEQHMPTLTIVEEHVTPSAAGHMPNRAVSWPAIFAGATGAAALSLVLLVLGMGLGFSALSPWVAGDMTADPITWSAIAWIVFAAVASSGLGGYIAGRLRERWPGTQLDEVYFRDTAHGFLAWAVATLLTAATLASVMGTIVGATSPGDNLVAAEMTEEVRRQAARTSLWVFVSLLIGAFTSSLMATFGGRQRDLP
jgi:MFS family permease